MAKLVSPLALKRGPKKLHTATLLKKLETLRAKKKKRRFLRPSSRVYPGQVEAGVEALRSCLWHDPTTGVRQILYEKDLAKTVKLVFKAMVAKRVERQNILERRKWNRAKVDKEATAEGDETGATGR